MKVSVLFVGWLSYYLSKSIQVAGVVTGAYLVLLIVIAIIIWQQRMERLRNSGIKDIDKMEGRQFEQYL
ncbi:hypothetical protein [Paenibacillus roseus]|uniref:hypothetical protein n=1 Tax=Paenibacillus sp. GCM10012307 TaxID=3317343 RepID=UPI0036D40E0A